MLLLFSIIACISTIALGEPVEITKVMPIIHLDYKRHFIISKSKVTFTVKSKRPSTTSDRLSLLLTQNNLTLIEIELAESGEIVNVTEKMKNYGGKLCIVGGDETCECQDLGSSTPAHFRQFVKDRSSLVFFPKSGGKCEAFLRNEKSVEEYLAIEYREDRLSDDDDWSDEEVEEPEVEEPDAEEGNDSKEKQINGGETAAADKEMKINVVGIEGEPKPDKKQSESVKVESVEAESNDAKPATTPRIIGPPPNYPPPPPPPIRDSKSVINSPQSTSTVEMSTNESTSHQAEINQLRPVELVRTEAGSSATAGTNPVIHNGTNKKTDSNGHKKEDEDDEDDL